MGNRGSKNKIYSVPSLFSVRHARTAYLNAPAPIKQKMNNVVAIKTNFRVYYSINGQYQLWINEDESMSVNTTSLNIILKSDSAYDDVGFLQFNLTDQLLFM